MKDIQIEIVYPNGDVVVTIDGETEYMTKEEYQEFLDNEKKL